MRDEAAGIEVRCKHVIRQNVSTRHGKVRRRLPMRDVRILRMRYRGTRVRAVPASDVLAIETVHAAIGTGKRSPAVAGFEKRVRAMVEIPPRLQPYRLQRNPLTAIVVTVRHRMRARIFIEQIIEAAVLLDDDDDVGDLVDPGRRDMHRGQARRSGAATGQQRRADNE